MAFKKRIPAILFLILGLAALSPVQKAAAESVVIDFWHLDIRDEHVRIWNELTDMFMRLHPGVTINITVMENEAYNSKLEAAMQAGAPPAVFRHWGGFRMRSWAEAGLLMDITDEYNNDWDSRLGAGAAGLYTHKGRIYGLPYDLGCIGIWYNKKLFSKAGITEPPVTWTAFLDCVKRLKAAGITPIALGEGDKWPGHFWWVYLAMRVGGKEAFDRIDSGEGSFTEKPWVQAGRLLKQLIDLEPFQKDFLTLSYGYEASLMGDGQAAMELMGQWAPAAQRANSSNKKGVSDELLGFMPFPAVEGGKGRLTDVMGGGNGLVIGKEAPPAAVEFLKFVTNVKNQQWLTQSQLGILPVAVGAESAVLDPPFKLVVAAVAKAEYHQLYFDQCLSPPVAQALFDATHGLFAGKLTPEKAARMLDEAYRDSKN